MDPQNYTSNLAKRLRNQIVRNRIAIDFQTNAIAKLQRIKQKLHVLNAHPTFPQLIEEMTTQFNQKCIY